MAEDIADRLEEVSDGHIPGPDGFRVRLLCWEAAQEIRKLRSQDSAIWDSRVHQPD